MTLVAAKGVFAPAAEGGSQRIGGLGFEPAAVIFAWARQAGEGMGLGNCGGFGFTAKGGASAAVAWASDDGATPTRAMRLADEAALVGLDHAGVERPSMRAVFASSDADGFTLDWPTPPASSWLVHYLALGGPSVTGASVGRFSSPVSPCRQRVGAPGFRPDLVLLAPTAVAELSTPVRGLFAGLGAAAGRRQQAGAGFVSRDSADEGEVGGGQCSDAALVAVADRDEFAAFGRIVSLDGDGLTIDWSSVWPSPRHVFYLALAGVRCKVGVDYSPTAPGPRRTRRVGFRPEALVLFTWGLRGSSRPTDIGRLCLGTASSIERSGCVSWDDRDVGARPTSTHVHSSTRNILVVTDTQTGGVHASASLLSLDGDGFSLDWTRSDGHRRQFAYVALAARSRVGAGGVLRGWRARVAGALARRN